MQLLLIEDDAILGKAILTGLNEAGHVCRWLKNGREGLDEATHKRFDAVVLDLLLPDLPGMDVMRGLRQAGVQTPVLMLTALGSVSDRVSGLKARGKLTVEMEWRDGKLSRALLTAADNRSLTVTNDGRSARIALRGGVPLLLNAYLRNQNPR